MAKVSKQEMMEAREYLARYLYPAEGEIERTVDVRGCWICRGSGVTECLETGAMEACFNCDETGAFVREYTHRREERPGALVYTKVTHVARSGMSRSIECFVIVDNEPVNISWAVARVMGERCDPKNGGVKVGGCGMDMGFHIVNYLSYSLHGRHNAHPLAGYTLRHRWL